jgi:hypothetical protein
MTFFEEAAEICFESGEMEIEVAHAWQSKICWHFSSANFHTRTVPSPELDAR